MYLPRSGHRAPADLSLAGSAEARASADQPSSQVLSRSPAYNISDWVTLCQASGLSNSLSALQMDTLGVRRKILVLRLLFTERHLSAARAGGRVVIPQCDPSSSHPTQLHQSSSSSSSSSSSRMPRGTSSLSNMQECTHEHLEEKLKQFQNSTSDDNKELEQVDKKRDSVPKTLRKRNLVFDEEHFQDAFLRCIICRDVYNEANRIPKTLPCQHTFCLHCFLEMFRVEGEYRQSLTSAFRGMPRAVKIQCPTCRDSIIASEDDLRRMPNDNTILELLRFVQETGITDIAYCTKHQLQPLNFFCEQCVTAVCCDCTVLDHKEKNGHLVMSIDEALGKYTPVIDNSISEMESRRQQFKEKRMEVSKRLDDVRYMEQHVSSAIKKSFMMIREVIKEREQMLLNMSEREVDKKRSDLQENLSHIKVKEENMLSHIKILETAKDEKDIQYMFNVFNMAQDSLVESLELPHRVDDDFGLSFKFEDDKMESLGSELKDFGNLVVGESNMTVLGMSQNEPGGFQ